jgi:hypothetical protein
MNWLTSASLAALLTGCGSLRSSPPADPGAGVEHRESGKVEVRTDNLLKLGMALEEYVAAVEKRKVWASGEVVTMTEPSIIIPAAVAKEASKTIRKRLADGKADIEAIKASDTAKTANFEASQKSAAAEIQALKDELAKEKAESHKFARFLQGVCLVIAVATLIGSAWFKPLIAISANAAGAALGIRAWIAADGFMTSIGWWLGAAIIGGVVWWVLRRWHKAEPPKEDQDAKERERLFKAGLPMGPKPS